MVQLPVGTVVRRPLVGLTPTRWADERRAHWVDSVLLDVRAQRIGYLERDSTLASEAAHIAANELMRCRVQASVRDDDYDVLARTYREEASQPKARPLLLSGQFYGGIGAGVVLTTLAKIFLHL